MSPPKFYNIGASRAMSSLPGWAKWSIIGAGVLLSPALAFLSALAVAVLVVAIKEAGLAAGLAAVGVGMVAYLGVRRLRGAPRDRFGDT
jgi:hypothetical protein